MKLEFRDWCELEEQEIQERGQTTERESERGGSAGALGRVGRTQGGEDLHTWKARPDGSVLGPLQSNVSSYSLELRGREGGDPSGTEQ